MRAILLKLLGLPLRNCRCSRTFEDIRGPLEHVTLLFAGPIEPWTLLSYGASFVGSQCHHVWHGVGFKRKTCLPRNYLSLLVQAIDFPCPQLPACRPRHAFPIKHESFPYKRFFILRKCLGQFIILC